MAKKAIPADHLRTTFNSSRARFQRPSNPADAAVYALQEEAQPFRRGSRPEPPPLIRQSAGRAATLHSGVIDSCVAKAVNYLLRESGARTVLMTGEA